MKQLFLLSIIASSLTGVASAQTFIEPVIGYQADFNSNKFKLINTAVQLSLKLGHHYEMLVLLQKSWGFPIKGNDSAFTPNLALPLYANAAKKITPSMVSVAFGHRFIVTRRRSINKLSLLVYTGLSFQRFSVNYQYDKANYTILNPDRSLDRSGIYISGGIEYMRILNNGRVFFQLLAGSPPSGKESKYPGTFHAMAPLNFNAGYSIPLQRKKK